MRRELWVDGTDLSYEWQKKRVKNLNLRVRPDGSIHVSTAGWVSAAAVDEFVRSHAGMIEKARQRWQNERLQEALTVENGAKLPCLGREMELVLRKGSPQGAELRGNQLVLTLPDLADRKAAERLLTGWWKKICGELFAAVLEQGKEAVVLIPEIALTFQTGLGVFRRLGGPGSVIPSGVSAGGGYDPVERGRRGGGCLL